MELIIRVRAILLVAAWWLVAVVPALAVDNLRVAYPSLNTSIFSLIIAQKEGYFKEENLNVEMLSIRGEIAIRTTLAGDVDFFTNAGSALAAGVLGDATKVRYVSLTAQNRFTALQSGEIDVLYRNSTQTYLRGVTLGLRQGPVNFYDGQGFVVRRDSGVKDLKGLNGATVCVAQGTTHEVTLGDYGRANGIEWKPLVFDRVGPAW